MKGFDFERHEEMTPELYRKYTETCQELKHLLPLTWRGIAGRRFQLPDHLVSDYVNQQLDHEDLFMRLVTNKMAIIEDAKERAYDLQYSAHVYTTSKLIEYGAPTYFMEREMGEAFLHTHMLPDLKGEDLQWRWPAFRLLLPKGLVSMPDGQHAYGVTVARIDRIADGFPLDLASVEMEREFNRFCTGIGVLYRSLAAQSGNHYGMLIVMHHGRDRNSLDTGSKIVLEQLSDTSLASATSILTESLKADGFGEGSERVRHLVLMILSYWAQTPPEENITANNLIRPLRPVGKTHFKPALWKPRWVGERTVFKNRPPVPPDQPKTGITRVGHWVAGHQKRQAHGPNRTLRKIIWLLPYRTKPNEEKI